MNRFRIYPSLLNAYDYYLSAEPDQQDERYKELMNAINRVPSPTSIAQSRGTALNEIVDIVGECKKFTPMPWHMADYNDNRSDYVCQMDGSTFMFDADFVKKLASHVWDAVPQVYCEAVLPTKFGDVLLYGYPDYLLGDTVIDLKSTQRYEPFKYEENWQRDVYAYCLQKGGYTSKLTEFTYLVAALPPTLTPSDVITGEVMKETYDLDDVEFLMRYLRMRLESSFLPFLEAHKDEITNSKLMSY